MSLNHLRGDADQPASVAFKILGAHRQMLRESMFRFKIPSNGVGREVSDFVVPVDEGKF